VRFSPNPQSPVIVSAGWDKLVKVCGSLLVRKARRRMMSEDAFAIIKVFATSELLGSDETIISPICTDDTIIWRLRVS